MELDLKELGLTFLAGAFVILTVEALGYYSFSVTITGFFEGDWGWRHHERGALDAERPTNLLVVVIFCFSIGLLMEDLCYKFSDTVAFPTYRTLKLPLTVFVDELRSEDGHVSRFTLQTSTLVHGLRYRELPLDKCENLPPGQRTRDMDITGLAYELASRKAFSMLDGARGIAVEEWLRQSALGADQMFSPLDETQLPADHPHGVVNLPHRCRVGCRQLTREDVKDSIQRLWYNAKNRVYRDEHYYQEIERMQSRLDFSRTLTVVSLFAIGVSLVLILIAEYWSIANQVGYAASTPPDAWRRNSWFRTAIFLLIFIAATVAYTRESLEINKRVFGYYSSMLFEMEQARTASSPVMSTTSALR